MPTYLKVDKLFPVVVGVADVHALVKVKVHNADGALDHVLGRHHRRLSIAYRLLSQESILQQHLRKQSLLSNRVTSVFVCFVYLLISNLVKKVRHGDRLVEQRNKVECAGPRQIHAERLGRPRV